MTRRSAHLEPDTLPAVMGRACNREPHPEAGVETRLPVQPKLVLGRPGDRYEDEADRIAEAVTTDRPVPMTGPLPVTPLVQRQAEEEDEEKLVQPKGNGRVPCSGAALRQAAEAVSGGGRPLPATERSYFETRLGRDLSAVRLHDDAAAARAAQDIGARAYTLGHNIAFGAGQLAPGTPSGRRLLAHELVHTQQQASAAAPHRLQRENGDEDEPAAVDTGPVTAITMARSDMRMRIETAQGSYTYALDTLTIPEGSYTGDVTVTGDNFELSFGTAYETEEFGFGYRVEAGQTNPARMLAGQQTVTVTVVDTLGSPRPARHVNPEIANLPAERYVDAFTEVNYDLDYRAEGGNLSTWLTVTYADGAQIDINVNDIADRDVDMVEAMANGHVGAQGRIFPSDMTRTTVPRLWAAKQEAIAIMEEYNYEFIVTALPAVIFIITTAGLPPLAGSRPVVRRQTRPRPVRPRSGASSGSGPAAAPSPGGGRSAASGTASGGAATAAGGSAGGGTFRIVSQRVMRYSGRDIVVVETSAGRQAFYRRTGLGGTSAGGAQAGQWAPFDGILAGWFNKARYVTGAADDALYRFGTRENRAASEWLGRQAIRAGDDVGEVWSLVNRFLDDLGALRMP